MIIGRLAVLQQTRGVLCGARCNDVIKQKVLLLSPTYSSQRML